jgi:predicted DNA-binding transcriptional regulator AlpA
MAVEGTGVLEVPGKDPDEWLTLEEAAAELKVARSTFYRWRQRRVGPKSSRLPNGEVRIQRRWLTEFAESRMENGGPAWR